MKIVLFLLTFCSAIYAQDKYPQDYFRSPLDIPLQLSGNFGELRSNHFHSGFDFRTQQKEGFNIYAAADGYVSRIKISAYGYGKAIYVTHPNGYTTLYGHLQKGSPRLEKYIKAQQYKEKAFEIEVFPKPDELIVRKGEIIALSGNTGGSQGPHLHYEIRESASEKVLNPILFYKDIVPDTRRPAITNMLVYPIGDNATVNRSKSPIIVDLKSSADGNFISEKIYANEKVGFGINTYDANSTSTNRNGVYKVEAFSNGMLAFGYQFDIFAFDESRYLNALIDYERYKRTSQRVVKLFMRQPFPLSIIKTNANNGIVEVKPNTTQTYRIEVSDFNNNKSTISVPIEYSALPATTGTDPAITPYFLRADMDNNYEKDNVSVFVPAKTFYEDFYLNFDVKDSILYFHNNLIPAHSNITITFKDTSSATEEQRDKMFIASVSGKKLGYTFTKRKGNVFTAYTKVPGQFKLANDTIAPKVTIPKPVEGKWITSQRTIDLVISDNLAGLKEFNGYLNGNWVLFEYDYKTRRITHDFADDMTVDGRNELKVVVSDNVGNSTIFETHFFRDKK